MLALCARGADGGGAGANASESRNNQLLLGFGLSTEGDTGRDEAVERGKEDSELDGRETAHGSSS